MKRLFFVFCLFAFVFVVAGASNRLVVFFSATGKTQQVADKLAKAMDADIWQIEPYEPYTKEDLDWRNKESRASQEYNDPTYRPTIKMCTDIRQYSVIFLGFPIWWNICPRIVQSWIENNDLTDKQIIVFGTSAGSDIIVSCSFLRNTYPDYKWITGKILRDSEKEELQAWKKQLEDEEILK